MIPDRLDILRLLLFAASIRIGAAIRCYECIPTEEDDCSKLPSSLANCSHEAVTSAVALLTGGTKATLDAPPDDSQLRCLKLRGSDSSGGPGTTIRTCMFSIPSICGVLQESVALTKGSKPAQLECFVCDTDGCNTAPALVPASLLLCLLAASAMS
ncbi:uncharacterized protein LOC134528073 [Bacillus rossius redtenbacheri]|uniref:uncharacterized protein LOC134528073 n=1 Tax=Bacillus rossius redtenbacheri TaxID=93214 RepID=UPI002FDE0608